MNRAFLYTALSLGFIIVVLAAYIYYVINKPVSDIAGVGADFRISSAELVEEYCANEKAANEKYLNKVVEIRGTVAEVNREKFGDCSVLIMEEGDYEGINCSFGSPRDIKHLAVGDKVTIKGVCTGKLIDVVLNKCICVKEN